MPRFIRPAWLESSADGPARGIGPRSRDGVLRARLTLRTANATVSDPIIIVAGGQYRDGSGHATLDIPRSMTLQVRAADGTVTVYGPGAIANLELVP